MHFSQPTSYNKGFTLIEVLVSLALFAIVMTMAVGTLVVLIDANAKAQTIETLVNGVSSAVDNMTREARTGYNYYCNLTGSLSSDPQAEDAPPGDCDQGVLFVFSESGTSLTEGLSSNRITYRLNTDNQIYRYLGEDTTGQPVTPAGVTITTFEVTVQHSDVTADGDNRNALATVYIEGTAGDIPLLDTSFQMQTTIAQQQLDI